MKRFLKFIVGVFIVLMVISYLSSNKQNREGAVKEPFENFDDVVDFKVIFSESKY